MAIVRQRLPDQLDSWLHPCETVGVVPAQNFALSLRQDDAAVRAVLELPWSSEQTAGNRGGPDADHHQFLRHDGRCCPHSAATRAGHWRNRPAAGYILWADFSMSFYSGVPQNVEAINAVLYGDYW